MKNQKETPNFPQDFPPKTCSCGTCLGPQKEATKPKFLGLTDLGSWWDCPTCHSTLLIPKQNSPKGKTLGGEPTTYKGERMRKIRIPSVKGILLILGLLVNALSYAQTPPDSRLRPGLRPGTLENKSGQVVYERDLMGNWTRKTGITPGAPVPTDPNSPSKDSCKWASNYNEPHCRALRGEE